MGASLLTAYEDVRAWNALCAQIDESLHGCPPPRRREIIAEAVQMMLRGAFGTQDIDVTYYLDPADLVTHFDVRVRGVAAVFLRDPGVSEQVRHLLAQVRDRYASWLEGVPLEERAEEAAALSDADLAHRARALRQRKHG